MGQVAGAAIFLIVFAVLQLIFTRRVKKRKPSLRRIQAFETLKGVSGQVVESGKMLHCSVGIGGLGNETTADTMAGLAVLDYLADQAATTGVPPVVSTADPMVLLAAQNSMHRTHADDPGGAIEACRNIHWLAPQPSAYAAGVMNLLDLDEVEANVMVGRFGDEYLLMGETSSRYDIDHIGGTSDPNALSFIYASADETLLGEEIYAAGAYLQERPLHIGSLLAQDTMRWVLILFIFGAIIFTSVMG